MIYAAGAGGAGGVDSPQSCTTAPPILGGTRKTKCAVFRGMGCRFGSSVSVSAWYLLLEAQAIVL